MKLTFYIAFLRSMYLFYQNAHWQCSGPNFYSLHLLFERLYGDVAKSVDEAAEKAIGLYSKEIVDLAQAIQMMEKIIEKYPTSSGNFLELGIQFEKDFAKIATKIRTELNEGSELTLGLDDMIMSQINESENRIYLLKQNQ